MTAGAAPRDAGVPGIESFLRQARARTRARSSRTDRFVDVYVALFVGVVLVAWALAGFSGVGAFLGGLADAGGTGGVLHRPAAPWVGPGVPVLGLALLGTAAWAGAVDLLRSLGPVGVAPERVLWVWPLPGAGGNEPVRAVRRLLGGAALAGGLAGGTGVLLLWGAGGPGLPGWQVAAHLVCWVSLGVGAVGVAARAQRVARVRRPSRPRSWAGWVLAAGAVLVLGAGLRDAGPGAWAALVLGLPTSWPVTVLVLPPAPAAGLACLLAVSAGLGAAGAARRARDLDGEQLRAAGTRTRHLANAVSLLSAADLQAALAPAAGHTVRVLPSSTPGWVRGPRTVALFASLTALRTGRWRHGLVVDLGLTVVVLASFAQTVVLAGWAALLVAGYRGLDRGTAYLHDLRAGAAAERSLPLGPGAAAGVHLLLPCALNAAVLGVVALLAGSAAGAAPGAVLGIGAVAGAGIGAVAVHRVLAPAPDHTQPPVDTPLGPVPVAQLIGCGRGLLLVPALLTAPAVVLLHPAGWFAAAVAAGALTVAAVVLAVRTDRRR